MAVSGVSMRRVVSGRPRVTSWPKQRDLAQQFAEGARGGRPVAHVAELVLDQRVVDDEQVREARVLAHGVRVLGR